MPDGSEPVSVTVHGSLEEIEASDWDACAGADNPFVSHAFLSACEESGAAAPEAGWLPQHVVVRDGSEGVLAAVPAYLKSHSYGEYVFDHGWADAFERAGGRYYPKLLVGVPFSPVSGPRLLVRPGPQEADARRVLIQGLTEVARRQGVSSLHVTFCTAEDREAMADAGFLCRVARQFHWQNRDYSCFDDFLGELTSRKRKNIRKEREKAQALGLDIRTLSGNAIEPHHWDAFYRFYLDTVDRKWANAYLNRAFFEQLGARLADRVVMIVAEDAGVPVAAALNLRGTDALYGRNWGCEAAYRFLHFECCYYQAMDYAIEHGLARVEAGAGGHHKLQRGYLPQPTYSAHWIAHEGFREAVSRFLDQETEWVAEEIDLLERDAPFRSGEG